MPISSASLRTLIMSFKCSSGVFPNCIVQCFIDPLHSKFITLPPASRIHSKESFPSTKPSTSTLSENPLDSAQRIIFLEPQTRLLMFAHHHEELYRVCLSFYSVFH